ncbi:hypothetical protein [uncultured Lacinutrix sp.]|uniref:PulJ/GspJ family protein n=1 Tax=uncultured Lacinutrix sp. TaxID=574032 RepID=UPI00260AA458|nr:hypothetical protein [uncultured Lacinutrix sp.]
MKTYKLQAYTLIEALITIVLSSIIVVVSYTLVSTISKQLHILKQENEEELEYNLMNSALLNDFNTAENATFENTFLELHYYNNNIIKYNFKNDNIIRTTKVKTDTFKIKTISYSFEETKSNSSVLKLKLKLFNVSLDANYYANISLSNLINKKYFNED